MDVVLFLIHNNCMLALKILNLGM
uniref:Uncharacterized protein n=1 Tax=Arundo donax TaxID=35708 RepID=A0A0A9ES42_ARUDO